MLQLDTSINKQGSRMSLDHQTSAGQKSLKNCGHIVGDVCDPSANHLCSNNCAIHTNGHDCYRPVTQVMAEHPGEDGYCYFNFTGFWVTPLSDDPDFEQYSIQGILGLRALPGLPYLGLHTGPILTYHFDGKVITTQMDSGHYSYDDLYGYSLGYLQGQGLDASLVKNNTNWISIVAQRCQQIQSTYNFTDEELVLADWLDDNQVLATKVLCSAGVPAWNMGSEVLEKAKWKSVDDCEPITPRDFAKHHYVKCALGYQNAASDAAYLNLRACLIGNHIGHFSDCPYSPNVSF
eukprot:Skav204043  [mRNA]  locus=scaffold3:145330:146371:- [translate_table: standard]